MVKGTTASCINWVHAGQDPTTASIIKSNASNWPTQVNESHLPVTLSPDDPDQCNERTNALQDQSNAGYQAAGLTDCIVMGY
jgi:hypothetical protein